MRTRKLVNVLFVVAGVVCVGLGILGMFLPLLPTTPFLLLAAFCFGRGSERLHQWLLNHRWCGKYITNFRNGLGLTVRQKVTAILVLWLSILNAAWWMGDRLWVIMLLASVACGVTIYLLRLNTYSGDQSIEQAG